jgi:hypothetical protein
MFRHVCEVESSLETLRREKDEIASLTIGRNGPAAGERVNPLDLKENL